MSELSDRNEIAVTARPRRWRKRIKWAVVVTLTAFAILAFSIRNPIRTLLSLRRVPNTNAYVMDYYCDYNIEEIRRNGMDPREIEDSFIGTFFSEPLASIAKRRKRAFVPPEINSVDTEMNHCSTVTLRSKEGSVYFGRNFDWPHDACLILRVHDDVGLASIAVIDLHYLNLDRSDLDQTNLRERLPLLFAPYYVMDGMNRHGVAISEMTVEQADAPRDDGEPEIIFPTLMRIILDYAKTTEDAIRIVEEFQVCFPYTPIHFMLADASGESRIVEFIDGEVRVTSSSDPWQVCTNDVVWNRSEQEKDLDCPRYQMGSENADGVPGVINETDAIEVTRSMAVENLTMWTSIYELQNGKFRFLYKAQPSFEYRDEFPRPADNEP